MKPSETAQINFIADCLRKGEQRKEILGKFGIVTGKHWETWETIVTGKQTNEEMINMLS